MASGLYHCGKSMDEKRDAATSYCHIKRTDGTQNNAKSRPLVALLELPLFSGIMA